MKKILALFLAAVMIMSLTCCKQNTPVNDPAGSSASQNGSTSETTDTPTADPQETSTPTPEATPPEDIYLKDVFAAHGMKVGTCFTAQMIDRAAVNNIVKNHFNSITMENAMKPDYIFNKNKSIETGELVIEFGSEALKIMKWAKENNYSMRGHTLVWYSQTPDWIFHEDFNASKPLVDRETMLDRMENYIKNVFATIDELGYTDIFYAYDVVNEAWMENGTMRQTRWSETIGDDYLWYAFYYADKYAPESIDLYYNDYNEQFKTQTLYNFVNTLVDENGRYLIDGIGFQAHLYTTDSLVQYFTTVEKLGSTGLKLQLTELDVCLGKYQAPKAATEDTLKEQGRFYYNLINGLFERVDKGLIKMDALTFWGMVDSMSWRKEYNPLLFNSSFKPKYALYGALQLKDYAGFDE